jgi:tetratricopeptide (TPR) repeat protein
MATRAGILKLLDKNSEADQLMQKAMDMATVNEIHNYARQLLSENKLPEAMKYFEYNYKKFNGIWPTHAGLMRGYSAMGDFKNALEHAKAALAQAPTEDLKKIMAAAVEKLSMGKPL